MSTLSHPPIEATPDRRRWADHLLVAEMWASLAITAMWIAVAVTAVWGPVLTSSTPGGSSTTIPSGVVVALFACIGSWAVAKHGFGHNGKT